jgi:hypothetical protein
LAIQQYGKEAVERLATATRSGMLSAADFVKLAASSIYTSAEKASLTLLSDQPVVFMYRNSALNITNAGAGTAVTWDTALSNTYGMWGGGNPTRITFPRTGWYDLMAGIRLVAGVGTKRMLWFQTSGGSIFAVAETQHTSGNWSMTISSRLAFAANDWIEVYSYQDAAATLACNINSVSTFVSAHWVRP